MTNTVNAKQRNQDPGMDAIIARMMNVTKRGTTLSTNQKYFVLLATCAAQGLSEEAEDVTAAALKAGVCDQRSGLSDGTVRRGWTS